jgi:hypothetical protein
MDEERGKADERERGGDKPRPAADQRASARHRAGQARTG